MMTAAKIIAIPMTNADGRTLSIGCFVGKETHLWFTAQYPPEEQSNELLHSLERYAKVKMMAIATINQVTVNP